MQNTAHYLPLHVQKVIYYIYILTLYIPLLKINDFMHLDIIFCHFVVLVFSHFSISAVLKCIPGTVIMTQK